VQAAHVRDVEDAAGFSRLLVLVDDRAIDDGHLPAGEIDHPRAGRDVKIVNRRPFQHVRRGRLSVMRKGVKQYGCSDGQTQRRPREAPKVGTDFEELGCLLRCDDATGIADGNGTFGKQFQC
jgi:hypothetical protein